MRGLVWFLAAVILATGLGIPALAAETGVIRVWMDYGGCDGGAVTLYPVAAPGNGGYRLRDSLGGGFIRQEDACTPELAQWLLARGLPGGTDCKLDKEGSGVFSGLEAGLYLLVQTAAPEGWQNAAPFLVEMPLNGQWEVLAQPKTAQCMTESPRTGQHPAPLFAAMGLVLSGTGLYFCIEKLRKR